MKKMLICGATGFIGRNLIEHFSSFPDHEVHAVWHERQPYEIENVIWHRGDLRKTEDVEHLVSGMDIILQAAATTSGSKDIVTRPYVHVTDNAVMNSLLLRSAFNHNVKHFVFFSCTVMYSSSEEAILESDFDASKELHQRYFGVGWTKVYVEKMCDFFSRMGRTRHTVIRHSNIYGPHDKYDLEKSHVFGATLTKVLTGDEKIVVWGTGEEERDLLHVEDLICFVENAIEKQRTTYEVFNCGFGKAISIRNLVEDVIRLAGKTMKIEHDLSQPSIKTSLFLDCSKAREMLDWEPHIDLEEGIKQTLSWYREKFLDETLL